MENLNKVNLKKETMYVNCMQDSLMASRVGKR